MIHLLLHLLNFLGLVTALALFRFLLVVKPEARTTQQPVTYLLLWHYLLLPMAQLTHLNLMTSSRDHPIMKQQVNYRVLNVFLRHKHYIEMSTLYKGNNLSAVSSFQYANCRSITENTVVLRVQN